MTIEDLKQKFPFPSVKPEVEEYLTGSVDVTHYEVFSHFLTDNTSLILEIGSYIGMSARLLLNCAKNASLICVDPWWGMVDVETITNGVAKKESISEYDMFISNMWDYKDRIIPVRSLSQIGLHDIYNSGVKPEMVYIDGWPDFYQVVAELELIHRFFPDAKIFGNEWELKPKDGASAPNVSGAVQYWCHLKNFKVQIHNNVFRIIK